MHRVLLVAAVAATVGAADRVVDVKKLPGYGGHLPFQLKAGTLDIGLDVEPYFWYVAAEKPSSDIIFTFSSQSGLLEATAGYGPIRVARAADSHGPFTVTLNPFRLSRFAHTVFVDAPTGVGFTPLSSRQPPSNAFAADTVNRFVSAFLKSSILKGKSSVVASNYSDADPTKLAVYLAGNLYDGHFLPMARATQSKAQTLTSAFNAGTIAAEFNYKGLILTSPIVSGPTFLPYTLATRSVSLLDKDAFLRCGNVLYSWLLNVPTPGAEACRDVLAVASEMGPRLLHAYTDACVPGAKPAPDGSFDACWQASAEAYFNERSVRDAVGVRGFDGVFSFSGSAFYTQLTASDRLADPMEHITTHAPGSRTLALAGDAGVMVSAADVVVAMNISFGGVSSGFDGSSWMPWYAATNLCQVGGYCVQLKDNAAVATVRQAGVRPSYEQPARVMVAIERFMGGDNTIGGATPPTIPKTCGPDVSWSKSAPSEDREVRSVDVSASAAVAPPPGLDGHMPTILPDVPATFTNNQYTGHVHVGGELGKDARHLFYWLIEADANAKGAGGGPAPLLLWLQGGPGCSGLFGMFTEIGPLRATDGGKSLKERASAWSKFAHVLIVEAPVCVGFSYVEGDKAICGHLNDTITLTDNYNFVVGFLQKFPTLAKSDLYVTGESYGGHYIPQLTDRIIKENVDGKFKVRLGGLAAGNPLTLLQDAVLDVARWASTPTISPALFDAITKHCTPTMLTGFQLGPCNEGTCTDDEKKKYGISDECWASVKWAVPLVGQPGNINFAAPPVDVCPVDTPDYQLTARTPYQPCGTKDSISYLNREDVQVALGVRKLNVNWTMCNDTVNLGWHVVDSTVSQVPLYQAIVQAPAPAPGYPTPRALVYSGDVDDIISLLSTQTWWKSIADKPKVQPLVLNTNGMQFAGTGMTANGDRFLFASVRGAGHEVPAYQPDRMISILTRFLGVPMPSLE